MPESLLAYLIIVGLALLATLPSFHLVKENEVLIIERLGKYHRSIHKAGIIFLIPLFERSVERFSTQPFFVAKKIKRQEHISHELLVSYKIQVFDEMLYTYGSLDAVMTIHNYHIEALKTGLTKQEIHDELLNYAIEYGFKILDIYYNNWK